MMVFYEMRQLYIVVVKRAEVVPWFVLGRTLALDAVRAICAFENQDMPDAWEQFVIRQGLRQMPPCYSVYLLMGTQKAPGIFRYGVARVHKSRIID